MNKLGTAKAALTALGLGLALSTASAGVINQYDFNGVNTGLGTSFVSAGASAGGPAVAVKGYLLDGGSWVQQTLSRINGGLGLGTLPGDTGGNTQVGPRVEGLLFDLGETFHASFRLMFSSFGVNDNTDIWASTTDIIANGFAGAVQVSDNGTSNPFTSQAMNLRYIFVASTDSAGGVGCNDGGNCFRVDDLLVVPEPGSLALVGAGLLAASALRRRRNPQA